uniref:Uncharacterized protein n=1 Tax=Chaetoceros debilis TaxID=122233 RepID=A0A7S3Q506_9STRA
MRVWPLKDPNSAFPSLKRAPMATVSPSEPDPFIPSLNGEPMAIVSPSEDNDTEDPERPTDDSDNDTDHPEESNTSVATELPPHQYQTPSAPIYLLATTCKYECGHWLARFH